MSALKQEVEYTIAIPRREEEIERERIEQEERKREYIRKKREKKLRKEKTAFKLKCILLVTVFASISLLVLKGYSNISEMRMNITSLENRKSELSQIKNSLVSEIEEAKGSIEIREKAMYKLSMDYPEEGQIVYLSSDKAKKE